MDHIDWDKIIYKDFVEQISLVVAVVKVDLLHGPEDLKIEVVKNPNGKFMGICNYEFWGPNQGDPYSSSEECDSIEDAVEDSLAAIRHHYRKEDPPDLMFWIKSNRWHPVESEYLDGNGHVLTYDEVMERRRKKLR